MIFKRHKAVDAAALADRIAAARAGGGDPQALLMDLARLIGEGFGADGCDIYRQAPDAAALQAAATWPAPGEEDISWLGTPYPLSEWPSMQAALGTPAPIELRVDGPGFSERERRDLVAWGILVTLGVRLEVEGRIVGLLVLNRRHARSFDADERELVRLCAPPVASAVDWAGGH